MESQKQIKNSWLMKFINNVNNFIFTKLLKSLIGKIYL